MQGVNGYPQAGARCRTLIEGIVKLTHAVALGLAIGLMIAGAVIGFTARTPSRIELQAEVEATPAKGSAATSTSAAKKRVPRKASASKDPVQLTQTAPPR